MHDLDPADLDGDGKFDAIDIAILEEGKEKNKQAPGKRNNGCCFSLTVIGFFLITAFFGARFCLA